MGFWIRAATVQAAIAAIVEIYAYNTAREGCSWDILEAEVTAIGRKLYKSAQKPSRLKFEAFAFILEYC